MRDLYRHAWEQLRQDRELCSEIEREATPVLFFGQWETARVITAGLNPSEDEFRCRSPSGNGKVPLAGAQQRFLHWEDGTLSETRLDEAFRRATGYFTLGNAYWNWFGNYGPFLASLQAPYASGLACHTDYDSPFATKTGIGKCCTKTKKLLRASGGQTWVEVLSQCPRAELVFGHGRGWKTIPRLVAMAESAWQHIPTKFDHKGGTQWGDKPHLLHAPARLPRSGRQLLLYWWKPNRDGSPLCYLIGL